MMAEHFANHGYGVVGCSRGAATWEHERYEHHAVDVGDEAQVQLWLRAVKRAHGRLDVVVCNAGIVGGAVPFALTPGSLLESLIGTQIRGTFFVCREAAKLMIPRKRGRIIAVSSPSVDLHLEGTSAYSSTKAAVVELTKIMAKELAPHGITCNVLAPGLVMTEPALALGEAWAQKLLARFVVPRVVTVEELCSVIAFYAAETSAPITGQIIRMGVVD